MKNIILLSILALGLFLTPQKVKAASPIKVHLASAGPNFSKVKFACILQASGLGQGYSSLVQSLYKKKRTMVLQSKLPTTSIYL